MSAGEAQRSARATTARLAAREISAAQLVEETLAVIAELDPHHHAFITVAADTARQRAREIDAAAADGRLLGPLHGLPVAIKDLTPTAGIRTTRGSRHHLDDVPDEDDLVVARLRNAGAIIIGKTNTPEFGFGALCRNEIAGNTVNPYARERTSGGSSGGSAVAVATGMVPLAHGTDFGGSVRTPASFCSIVGFRPGAGTVPRMPKGLPWETLATHGILARSAGDAELMLQAIAGGDPRDPVSVHAPAFVPADGMPALGALRLAASPDLCIATIDPAVASVFEGAVTAIAGAGAGVTRSAPDFSGAQQAFETLRAAMLFHDFGPLLDRPGSMLSPTVRWNVERGRGIAANDVIAAEVARGRIYQSCIALFDDVDFLLTPSASVLPFPLDQEEILEIAGKPLRNIVDYLTITYAVSLTGLPAMSIPCGWTGDGLPVGMQIVGPPRSEAALLAFGRRLEHDLSFRHRFPGGA